MKAAYVSAPSAEDPVGALEIGEVDAPTADSGWVEVEVHAGALNMHDIWMLRGAVPLPNPVTVIGSDGAGVAEGREVMLYPVMPLPNPGRNVAHGTLVSDLGYGVLADTVVVPRSSVVAKPTHLTWAEAAALPTAWLTAYRMLISKANVQAGEVVLVQGGGGGVATAAIAIATAVGASVVVTSRSAEKRERAVALGAAAAFEPGTRLPDLADVVIESVGSATLGHSISSAGVGGRIVVCGSSTGFTAELDLARLFARELTVMGSTTGSLEEFQEMVGFVDRHGLRPAVDSVVGIDDARDQVRRMLAGTGFGKLCVGLR